MNSPYAPPASRPSNGGIVRPTRHPLWRGFGWGWAAIAFTFLWTGVAFPLFVRFTSLSNGAITGAITLVLLIAPTLALSGHYANRREWKAVLGVVLAWVSAILLIVLFIATSFAILGRYRVD